MTLSKIEWTDRSDWNPIRGCTRVSPGCGGPGPHGGCYAEAMAARFSKPGQWGHGFAEMVGGKPRWTGKVELQEDRLTLPLRWKKPAKIFISSTSDLFHPGFEDDEIARVIAYIGASYWHTHQLLTKRPERAKELLNDEQFVHMVEEWLLSIDDEAEELGLYDTLERRSDDWRAQCPDVLGKDWPLKNLWLGTSTEDQERAAQRVPHLLNTTAAVKFISYEPALGPVDLTWLCDGFAFYDALHGRKMHDAPEGQNSHSESCAKLDWVICGGESGPHARPMHPDWARAMRDQCAEAGVPFFFKQWGENHPSDQQWADGRWGTGREPGVEPIYSKRGGKAAAGRTLDGVEHSAFPEAKP